MTIHMLQCFFGQLRIIRHVHAAIHATQGVLFTYFFTYIAELVSLACQGDCKLSWRSGLLLFNINTSC
uniref:Uncharacterized protein n=1 Tax=Arundo donax TaxID=35708 RepID=A0A0A9E308_ARUDO